MAEFNLMDRVENVGARVTPSARLTKNGLRPGT